MMTRLLRRAVWGAAAPDHSRCTGSLPGTMEHSLASLDLPPSLQALLDGLTRQTWGIDAALRRHLQQGATGHLWQVP